MASGKGGLHSSLYLKGYRNVTSWDVRKRNARTRPGYKYGLFDHRNAPRDYDLVVGMHPDEATDQIVAYAVKHRKPFIICPCCIKPTASTFQGVGFDDWLCHLIRLAEHGGIETTLIELPMKGKNQVIVGEVRAADF